jgi:vacuolar-type H+-ATPase subunit I/STV1
MDLDSHMHKKQEMEFLAALNLVPHSVKCEVWKRQKNTKSQFGNWWERLHSQNFSMIQSFTQEEDLKDEEKADDDSSSPVTEQLPEKVEDVYVEVSRLQTDISAQSETQQQLLEAVSSLKHKLSSLSEQKQIYANEGNKLLTSMQTLFEWASL